MNSTAVPRHRVLPRRSSTRRGQLHARRDLQLEGRRGRSCSTSTSTNAENRPTANFRTQVHALLPYMKATFGPVYIEGEVVLAHGKTAKYEAPATASDIDKEGLRRLPLWRSINIGPAYVGGQFGYSSGDPNDTTKDKSGPVSTTSWVPALIFANANLRSWQYNASQVRRRQRRFLQHRQAEPLALQRLRRLQPDAEAEHRGSALLHVRSTRSPTTLRFRQARIGSRPQGDLQDLRQPDLHGGRGVSLDRRLLQGRPATTTRSETTTS